MKEKKLIQRGMVFGIFFILLAAMIVITMPNASAVTTIHVSTSGSDSTGTGSEQFPYRTIQKGINMASSGDTVYVYDGTYTENVLITTSNIILEGESREGTIIDGGGSGHVVEFSLVDGVSMDKFTVQNSGSSNSGIFLHGSPLPDPDDYVNKCTITNINCEDNFDGIKLYYAGEDSSNFNTFQYIYCNIEDHYQDDNSIHLEKYSNYNEFSDCYILQSQDNGGDGAIRIYDSDFNDFGNIEISGNSHNGFHLECDSDDNTIYNCEISGIENGIYLDGTSNDCTGNTIIGCDIDCNENACIYIDTCDLTTIQANNMDITAVMGSYVIVLTSSVNNIIENNVIMAANVGIYLSSGSDSNVIRHNLISSCSSYGVEIDSSDNNQIDHNNFIGNNGAGEVYLEEHIQAYDADDNNWDNGYPDPNGPPPYFDIDTHGGNYWSDWTQEGFPDPPYDDYSGPDQNSPGTDGIADHIYEIEGGADDFYPLGVPVEID